MAREVTRKIPEPVSNYLWGRAAARCEFDGHNLPLSRSPVTQETVNLADRAHIYSFSEGGPRGNEGVSDEELNAPDNLILVCGGCHRLIDQDKAGVKYSAGLLQAWKLQHERRVELVTGIHPDKKSRVVTYGANVGELSAPLSAPATMPALFPDRYPASPVPIQLGMVNSAWRDRSDAFWPIEEGNLVAQYTEKLKPGLATGNITHMSVFAFAPQPLLMRLGTLLSDVPAVDVYPLLREPKGWGWGDGSRLRFKARPPVAHHPTPALVLSLSATITHDRITSVLGPDVAIWELTIPNPNNDAIRKRDHLQALRQKLRFLFDRIKAFHGQSTLLHVFPAMSVASAVEFGRVRMPKADMPWLIYDQINERGGFVPALRIPGENE